MTDEEAILNEAKQVVDAAGRKARKAQSKEHIASMPHLLRMAQEMVRRRGVYEPLGAHLLSIRESKDEVDLGKVDNPLGVPKADATAAELILTHSFSSLSDATEAFGSIHASMLYWEATKLNPTSLLLLTHDNLLVNYFGRHLTVSRATIGDDMVTNYVDIGVDNTEPNEFFSKCELSNEESLLVTSLLSMAEAAKMLESDSPAAYAVNLKRLLQVMKESREGEGD